MLIQRKSTSEGNSIYPSEKGRSWDTRTWLVAVCGSALFIFLAWLGRFTPFENAVSSRISVSLWGDDAGGLLSDGAIVSSVFILPFVLTMIARRRAFLWGGFPYLAATIADLVYRYYAHASRFTITQDFYDSWWVIPVWLFVSGLGVLIRTLVRRGKLRRAGLREGVLTTPDSAGHWPSAPKQGDKT